MPFEDSWVDMQGREYRACDEIIYRRSCISPTSFMCAVMNLLLLSLTHLANFPHPETSSDLMLAAYWQINAVKNDILKLFDSIEKYGMCSFAFISLNVLFVSYYLFIDFQFGLDKR